MADQPDYTGSCMIALYPPPEVAAELAIDEGLDPDSIHLTVAYTGDAADVNPEALQAAAETLTYRPPITAAISGHARFTGGDDGDCIVALADSPQLDQLRRDTETALAAQGIVIPSEHGFTAHMSIAYLAAEDDDPVGRLDAFPVTFTAVSAVHGKDRTDYPFTDLAAVAAEAYAAGVAISGGPVTERILGGCAAAVATVLEHAGDPRVLELALDLGKLEGTWAMVYDRRGKLIAGHVAAVGGIWRKAVKHLDIPRMVRAFRHGAGMTRETNRDSDSDWTQVLRAEARALAAGMLNGIRSGPEFDDLVTAIELALAASIAEGKTGALAVAAEEAGYGGFDWAAAFGHMYEPLTHLEDLPGMADPWVEALIDGNAADIGRALAALAADGGTYEQMVTAVEELTSGDSIRAVITLIDYAMSGSANQGALNLYASEGIEAYDVMNAADPCPICLQAAEDNPHTLQQGQVPVVPAHPRCRCCTAPALTALPFSAFSQFLKAAA